MVTSRLAIAVLVLGLWSPPPAAAGQTALVGTVGDHAQATPAALALERELSQQLAQSGLRRERAARLAELKQARRARAPAARPVTGGQQILDASTQQIVDAFFSADATRDCRPYLTGVTVTPHDPRLLTTKTTYGACAFPTEGPDFLVLGSGDPDLPSQGGDLDGFPDASCEGDNVQITFAFDFPDVTARFDLVADVRMVRPLGKQHIIAIEFRIDPETQERLDQILTKCEFRLRKFSRRAGFTAKTRRRKEGLF